MLAIRLPQNSRAIYAITFGISLFLTWTQIVADPVINKDAILYLQSAHFIQVGDWELATKNYNWPFYSLLIAMVSTGLDSSLETAAHLLDGLLTATTACLFIALVRSVNDERPRLLWFAALIVLCFPQLNEYRNMIIRDHGYWCFYLLGCLTYVNLTQRYSRKTFALFALSWILAALFRVEGLVFLVLLSLHFAWTHQASDSVLDRTKWRRTAWICFLVAIVIAGLWLVHALYPGQLGKVEQFFRYFEWLAHDGRLQQSPYNIARDYLNALTAPKVRSDDLAGLILGTTIASILIGEIFNCLGWIFCSLLGTGAFLRIAPERNGIFFQPWSALIGINVLTLLTFVVIYFFLTGRYPIALALTLMLYLPFVLDQLYERYWINAANPQVKRWLITAVVLFSLTTLDSLMSFGASKTYLKQAGEWIDKNMAEKDTAFSNDPHVTFYIGRTPHLPPRLYGKSQTDQVLTSKKAKQYAYIALEASRKDKQAETHFNDLLNSKPIKIFANKRGDRVLVYRP